jgi:uncharacterized protein YbjT (DUF2867 family)
MDGPGKVILVSGATGQQGGAAARHLLAGGWRVRALVRDPEKAAARALATAGAELVVGDMSDRPALEQALRGAHGAFSVQNFWLPDVGAEGEVRQGTNLADAAQAAGVRHFVYTSVGGADRKTGIPHFESKWRIEQHIRGLGLPATIFRPVFFMESYTWNRDQILGGTFFSSGLHPERRLQLIAVDDIGALVRLAFERPEEFVGRALEIAGDGLTEPQIAAVFSRVIGRPVTVAPAPPSPWNTGPEAEKMTRWLNEEGYRADITALRRIHPGLQTLEQHLRRSGWENAALAAS